MRGRATSSHAFPMAHPVPPAPLLKYLGQSQILGIIYIDDMLVLAVSQDQASLHLEILLWVRQTLGFTIN